jgi:hypothetical protein
MYLAPPPPVWLKCPLRHRSLFLSLISLSRILESPYPRPVTQTDLYSIRKPRRFIDSLCSPASRTPSDKLLSLKFMFRYFHSHHFTRHNFQLQRLKFKHIFLNSVGDSSSASLSSPTSFSLLAHVQPRFIATLLHHWCNFFIEKIFAPHPYSAARFPVLLSAPFSKSFAVRSTALNQRRSGSI